MSTLSEGAPQLAETTKAEPEFPVAVAQADAPAVLRWFRRAPSRLWWLTGLCLIIAVALVLWFVSGRGPQITVAFASGHGIKPGDALRYLGIEVGQVVAVELSPDLKGLRVQIAVDRRAAGLARDGSRFWIERPRLSLARMSGLDTVVGANYVGVIPGPAGAKSARYFQGLETPPTITAASPVQITVRFRDGHGLAVGDPVKHRGIVVGEVIQVSLDEGLSGVVVEIQLVEGAAQLARAGSQFWVERPQIDLSGIHGLETVVGGRYVAVSPGPAGSEPLTEFDGLDKPPAVPERAEGGLEIILEGPDRGGLEPGAPVKYRGIPVGRITSVGLSSDAVNVEARAYIRPESRQLIRDNTRFWTVSGLEVSMGLKGVRMDIESLASLAVGGVALGTPNPPGKVVATGHRFHLHDKPDDAWVAWQPSIPLGSTLLAGGLTLPHPMRASLHWKERNRLGLAKDRQRDGWVLALEGGRLLGPTDLLVPVEGAIDNQTSLAVAGQQLPLVPAASHRSGRLAVYLQAEATGLERPWPQQRIRAPKAPEDCVLIGDAQGANVPLSAGRFTREKSHWQVDPSVPLDSTWHGACVVSRQDGALIGVLLVENGRAQVAPLISKLVKK